MRRRFKSSAIFICDQTKRMEANPLHYGIGRQRVATGTDEEARDELFKGAAGLQPQVRQARMIVRATAERPMEFAICRLHWEIVDGSEAALHWESISRSIDFACAADPTVFHTKASALPAPSGVPPGGGDQGHDWFPNV
jgi:hypothetical protein